jgi:outer membrane protein assembly factor BamB
VERRWETPTFSEERLSNAPVIAGDVVVLGSQDFNLYVIDAASGSERWRLETDAKIRSTPVIADNTVFVGGNNGILRALDLTTGEKQWRTRLEHDHNSRLNYAGGRLYVQGDGLAALNPTDGTVEWQVDVAPGLGGPAIVDGTVYANEQDTNRVSAFDAADGSREWRARIQGRIPYHASPVVGDATLFLTTHEGVVHALDVTSGDTRWRFDAGAAETAQSTPAFRDGTLYYGTDRGILHAVDVGSGEEQWRVETPGRIRASPIVLDETLYFGIQGADTGRLYAADALDGAKLWRYDIGEDVVSLSSAGGWLYTVTSAGNLYGFAPGSDSDSWGDSSTRDGGSADVVRSSSTDEGDTGSSPSGNSGGEETSESRQRGFFTNSGDEPAFISDAFNLTTMGFLLSVGGIIHQLMEGD